MASVNPLRYRSYYYDTETGWYYLQSRYYDPVIGRFINSDVFLSTSGSFLGLNAFAYCENNPVNHSDPTGTFIISGGTALIIGIGIVVAGACGYLGGKSAEKNGGSFWPSFGVNAALGAVVYTLGVITTIYCGPEVAFKAACYARMVSSLISNFSNFGFTDQDWSAETILPAVFDSLCMDMISSCLFYYYLGEFAPCVSSLLQAAWDLAVDYLIEPIFYGSNVNSRTQILSTYRYYENASGYPVSYNYTSYTHTTTIPQYCENAQGYPVSYIH